MCTRNSNILELKGSTNKMTFERGNIKDLWTIIAKVGKQSFSKNLGTSSLMFSFSHCYFEVGPIKKLGQFLYKYRKTKTQSKCIHYSKLVW